MPIYPRYYVIERDWEHSRRCAAWFVAWWECVRAKRPVSLLVVPLEDQYEMEVINGHQS